MSNSDIDSKIIALQTTLETKTKKAQQMKKELKQQDTACQQLELQKANLQEQIKQMHALLQNKSEQYESSISQRNVLEKQLSDIRVDVLSLERRLKSQKEEHEKLFRSIAQISESQEAIISQIKNEMDIINLKTKELEACRKKNAKLEETALQEERKLKSYTNAVESNEKE
ncbi:uncharacterized protein MONOS_17814 [Monocercomonoides exilis]|uniref:uncharacterized protein n=1 Tax=Monocercomonoides exilis TaxID=2049356 RepID=UPI003559DE3B|nr:hypothetical protein MONOS_17814 [Monocercomonoides exilis]